MVSRSREKLLFYLSQFTSRISRNISSNRDAIALHYSYEFHISHFTFIPSHQKLRESKKNSSESSKLLKMANKRPRTILPEMEIVTSIKTLFVIRSDTHDAICKRCLPDEVVIKMKGANTKGKVLPHTVFDAIVPGC
jgi:hypothetical protein